LDIFQSKVAIVTGGASGIGRALSAELARRGATAVIVADIDSEGAQQVASLISSKGGHAQAAHVNVSKGAEVADLVDETVATYGFLDYMFNNAGLSMRGEMRDMAIDHWQQVIAVNLVGVIHGTMAAYPVMVRQQRGHIINTAGLGGLVPEPMAVPYATTKHAVVGLSTSLRTEAAGLGVNVSVFCPGTVKTSALENATYVGVRRDEAIQEMTNMGVTSLPAATRALLRGVERNKAIITDGLMTRLLWLLYRVNPTFLIPFLQEGIRHMRALRVEE
jgi:NAD(P)-dependent dehydrogenase (short-subunit alcohol dehydrogenase family)